MKCRSVMYYPEHAIMGVTGWYQEMTPAVIQGNDQVTGHIISTTIGGKNGEPKRTISYMAEHVVGTCSFGIVFQVLPVRQDVWRLGRPWQLRKSCKIGVTRTGSYN